MNTRYINPPSVAAPPWPHVYPHGILAGGILFISGQVAFNASGETVGIGDARAQAAQAWSNIGAVLEAAGLTFDDVVRITIFLTDIRHAEAELEVRHTLFMDGRFPTCTMVQVANLGLPELLMEIEATAVVGASAPAPSDRRD